MRQLCGLLITLLFAETAAEKKYCWYFEGDYPVYFVLNRMVVKEFIQMHSGKKENSLAQKLSPFFNGFNKSNLSQVLLYSQPLTYATGGRICLCHRCKTYEDCCGTQCCVRALSVQRIWYFWLLLIIGILCCCSTGYFIRRRVHPYPPPEGPDFNVSFTRHPIIAPGLRQAGFHNYGDSETAVISTVYPVQTHPGHVTAVYSALPSYYSQPPPSYDQVMQDSQKK